MPVGVDEGKRAPARADGRAAAAAGSDAGAANGNGAAAADGKRAAPAAGREPHADGEQDAGRTPFLSVVIASVNGRPFILECLEALTSQQGNVSYEILVLDCTDEETRREIRRRFPGPEVQLIPFDERLSVPKLRAVGMARARGRMVAILEDHCNVVPDWMQVIRRAHEAGHRAIGGTVENGSTERLIDWAVFFCEYARFMSPMPEGKVPEITGNNSVYDREVLDRLGPELQEEVWEAFLHQRMKELGVEFHCEPRLLVSHKKEFPFGYFMGQRYHYSRSFAGMRMAGAPAWKRLAYAGAALVVLPPLLLLRMYRTVWGKGRLRGTLAAATPAILVFLVSWAWGEAVGALLGPGDSLARVE